MILVRCINGFYEPQRGFLGIRTTFEALLAAAVMIIPAGLLRSPESEICFIGRSTEKVCSFVRKKMANLMGICEAIYLLIFGLNWLNFRLRELLFCTKICTKASSLVLLQFYFGSTLVP